MRTIRRNKAGNRAYNRNFLSYWLTSLDSHFQYSVEQERSSMSQKEDVAFLRTYLTELQKKARILPELCREDLVMPAPDALPATSEKAEQVARFADENGFDGSLYRNLIPTDNPLSLQATRQLHKQIETLPKIIANIEKADKSKQGWHIKNGQVFYNGKDLQFPSGQIQEVLKILVDSEGKTVTYSEFDKITTLDKYRHYISDIRKRLENSHIPYEIKTLTNEGYKLQKIIGS